MNNKNRQTDITSINSFIRTDRIISENGVFYYKTREGGVQGVFETRSEALYDLNLFVANAQIEKELLDFDLYKAA